MTQEEFIVPENALQVGAIHAHYKNLDKEYQVTGMSLNSDTDEWHVEYVPLYEGAVAPKFNRSLSTWLNMAIVDGKEVVRYPFVRMG
jgi:hypothetical protein